MDEQKLEELIRELEGTNIRVKLVDGSLEVMGVADLAGKRLTMHNEDFLNLPVSNITVDLIEFLNK